MSVSTLDHAPPAAEVTVTAAGGPQITAADAPPIDAERQAALALPEPQVHPEPQARLHYAGLLYSITGWQAFREEAEEAERRSYAQDAASYEAEDAERRATARRRRPPWADED